MHVSWAFCKRADSFDHKTSMFLHMGHVGKFICLVYLNLMSPTEQLCSSIIVYFHLYKVLTSFCL